MTDDDAGPVVTIGFAVSDVHGGLGYYRGRVPARMLLEAGRDAAVGDAIEFPIGGGPLALVEVDDAPGYIAKHAGAPFAPHVVVLAGSFPHHARAGAIKAAQAAGQAVIVDIDDSIWLPEWHPHHSPEIEVGRLAAIAEADIVTAGTPAIADEIGRYSARPPVVVPNVIDCADAARALGFPPRLTRLDEREFVIGYRGPLEYHRGDLDVMGDALAVLHRRRPYVRFVHVGADDPAPFADWVGVPVEVVEARPLVAFDHYLERLAGVDVAVLPYSSTSYSRAKGAQGGLEWTMAGVPWVASAQPALLELALNVDGAGHRWGFALEPADWLRFLEQLAARPTQRNALWSVQMRACAPRVFGLEPWLRQELEVPLERVTGQWLTAIDQAVMRRGGVG